MTARSMHPRQKLAHLPTPLEPMDRLRTSLGPGCPKLYVKRDDCTGLATGGNKTRKLEFLAGDALHQGCDALITVGALQSNHVRQTAAAAAALGMACHVILFRAVPRDEPAYQACGNILLDRLLGAEITIVEPDQVDEAVSNARNALESRGRRPYVVPYGGSSAFGALGYVFGFRELFEDLRKLNVDAGAVVHASSSGATQAGLVVGAAMLEANIAILGVNVLKPLVDDLKKSVELLSLETARLVNVPPEAILPRIRMVDGYLGAAYGLPTDGMLEAVRLAARTEGLLLDPVYSGKAMAALIGEIRKGRFSASDTVVFLHTGGASALHAYPELFEDVSEMRYESAG